MTERERGISWGVFIPMLLVITALVAQSLYQAVQLSNERTALEAQHTAQTQPLDEAQNVRAQVESLAGATAALAEQGNPNAARLRDYLRQQGVTIRPPPPAAPPAQSP